MAPIIPSTGTGMIRGRGESDSVITAWIALTPSTPQSDVFAILRKPSRSTGPSGPPDRGTLQLRDTEGSWKTWISRTPFSRPVRWPFITVP